eukprot:Clim_evm5s53 gene=Clim_evmTU5s53
MAPQKTKIPKYAVEISPGKEGESGIWRHKKVAKGDLLRTVTRPDGTEITTAWENFAWAAKTYPSRNCVASRKFNSDGTAGEFQWKKYKEVREIVEQFAKGLLELNICPENEDSSDPIHRALGFYCKNREEWFIAQMACHMANITVVPLYDTLGPDVVQYICEQTGLHSIVAGPKEAKTLAANASKLETVKNVIQLPSQDGSDSWVESIGDCKIYKMEDILAAGKEAGASVEVEHPKPENVAILGYTSGTTGNPKGVMNLHSNLIAAFAGGEKAGIHVNHTDVHLSYLPLAHIFEQIILVGIAGSGSAVGYYRGDPLKLVEDITVLRPTIFPSVPRLWNRIYDRIMGGVQDKGGLSKFLFMQGYKSKENKMKQGVFTHGFWDKLVFGKVAGRVGLDRCSRMLTGSAPIAPHVHAFLRIVFSCPVLEGYGQTEGAAATTLSKARDPRVGHVGGPVCCIELKTVDVPEMNYTAQDKPCPRGEICYRGPSVFPGYYKMPEKTKETLDEDGWCHTGDIGVIQKDGSVKIIDRKKNIFKLAQGEYVAAEKIENIMIKSQYISQCFIYGDSLHSYLVAIAVIDQEQWPKLCAEKGFDKDTPSDDAKKFLLEDLRKTGQENKLNGFELPKQVHIETIAWTPDDEESILTPTFKLKRKPAQERYQAQIDEMYKDENIGGKSGLKVGA